MSTYTSITYHIVFGPKGGEAVLVENRLPDLYGYIYGICKAKNCHVYRIGGVENHLHVLVSLHPAVALADLVKDIKVATNFWNKEVNAFPLFRGWQEGYYAGTVRAHERPVLINYIKRQKEHHARKSFSDEYVQLLEEEGIVADPRFLPWMKAG